MVSAEEIVERTFYISLLNTAINMGMTLNPDDYLPITASSDIKFKQQKAALEKGLEAQNLKFVSIFGVGNNQSRGAKYCPRITVDLQAYYPGQVGMEKFAIEAQDEGNYGVVSHSYETKDISIDVHLVADNMIQLRALHNIMYKALPARGYLIPYLNNDYDTWKTLRLGPTDNLYIEIGNYYDYNDNEHGFLEKVYNYRCIDAVLDESVLEDVEIVPIKDILVLLGPEEKSIRDLTHIHVTSSDS